MSNDTRPSHHRARAVLATSAAVMLALVLAQCRPIVDNVLGIKAETTAARGASTCVTVCAKAYNDSIGAETTIHVQNAKSCAGDSICLALEEIRHEAAVTRIQTARQDCINGCHHQGGGTGGR